MNINGTQYHQYSDSDNRQVDKMMIANMLNALNNPHILKMLDENELMTILLVVKNHVVTKAENALQWQEKYIDSQERMGALDFAINSKLK